MTDIAAEARRRIVSAVWDDLIDQHAEGDLCRSLLGVPTCGHPECVALFVGPDLYWEPGDWGTQP